MPARSRSLSSDGIRNVPPYDQPKENNNEHKDTTGYYREVAEFAKPKNLDDLRMCDAVADKILNSYIHCRRKNKIEFSEYVQEALYHIRTSHKNMNLSQNSRTIRILTEKKLENLQKGNNSRIRLAIHRRSIEIIGKTSQTSPNSLAAIELLFKKGYYPEERVMSDLRLNHEEEHVRNLIATWQQSPDYRPETALEDLAAYVLEVRGIPVSHDFIRETRSMNIDDPNKK